MSDMNNEMNNSNDFTDSSLEEMYEILQDSLSLSEVQILHDNIGKQQKQQQAAERKSSARGNPQLQQAQSLEIHPDNSAPAADSTDAAGAMLYSNEFIPERHTEYVNEGEIASRSSPAAYLAELYKHSSKLHPSSEPYHIDQRRPDIGQLLLSQENQDNEISTLILSNEILTEAIRKKSGTADVNTLLKTANEHYDAEFEKWQQVLKARKTTAVQLWPANIIEETPLLLDLGVSPSRYVELGSTSTPDVVSTSSQEMAFYYDLPLAVVEETERLLTAKKDQNSYRTALHRVFLLYRDTRLPPQVLVPVILKYQDVITDSFSVLYLAKILLQDYRLSLADVSKIVSINPDITNDELGTLLAHHPQLTESECKYLWPLAVGEKTDPSRYVVSLLGVFKKFTDSARWFKRHELNLADLTAMMATPSKGTRATIYQRLELSELALSILELPGFTLKIKNKNGKLTLEALMELSRFNDRISSLAEQQVSALYVALKNGELTLQKLVAIIGEKPGNFDYLQYTADAYKPNDTNITSYLPNYSNAYKSGAYITDFSDIETVLYWQQAAGALQVPVKVMLPLYDRLHTYKAAAGYLSSLMSTAFNALPAPDMAKIEATLTEEYGNALVHYYLTNIADKNLNLTNHDDLYSYLLIDNQVSMEIKTTRIAEAISSLQLYINRCRYQPKQEPGVSQAVLKRAFFSQWDRYNKGYSTWAGIKQLAWFPENYIDPAMRIGQTSMMETLLQTINQGQLSADTVQAAFKTYLTEFEEIANLSVISGYHNDASIEQGLTYFIGESLTAPPAYYWRTVDHAQFSEGKFPATAWSEWKKITAAATPYQQLIRPVRFNGRLYLLWLERNEDTVNRKTEVSQKWRYQLKLSHLRYDGTWSVPFSFDTQIDESDFNENSAKKEYGSGLHCTTSGTPTQIRVCLYKKQASYSKDSPAKLWVIDEMMTLTELTDAADIASWVTSQVNEFDTLDQRRIGNLSSEEIKLSVNHSSNKPPVRAAATGLQNIQGFANSPFGFTDIKILNSTEKDITLQFKPNPVTILGVDNNTQLTANAKRTLQRMRDKYDDANKPCIVYSGSIRLTSNDLPSSYGRPKNEYYTCAIDIVIAHRDSHNFTIHMRTQDTEYSGEMDYGDRQTVFEEAFGNKKLRLPNNKFIVLDWLGRQGRIKDITIESYTSLAQLYEPDWANLFDDTTYVTRQSRSYIHAPDSLIVNVSLGGETKTETCKLSIDQSKATYQWDKPMEVTLPIPANSKHIDIDIKMTAPAPEGLFYGAMEQSIPITVIPVASDNYLTLKTNKAQAQYLEWGKQNKYQVRLNTLFAKQLVRLADSGIDNILSPNTQLIREPNLGDNTNHAAHQSVDFGGANALYFWELFYYTPMLVMQRLLQEQDFDLASHWLNYVFNPAQDGTPWNTRPLQEDTAWNKTPLDSTNPDAVAQADPMHYKLSTFMRLLDLLLARGDQAYRRLQRGSLAEAKMWYVQASTLLGEEPERSANITPWKAQTLKDAAGQQNRLFMPQHNTKLQGYHQTLKLRLYNLRHNLSIDGQPQLPPMFDAPADPKKLLSEAATASQDGKPLPNGITIGLQRFPVILDSARSMVGQLIQFGNSLSNVIERQDAEQMATLMQTQGKELLAQSVSMQKKSLEELHHETIGLAAALAGAQGRYEHYNALYDENINTGETSAIVLRSTAGYIAGTTQALHMTAAALDMVPNIYGMAVGGARYGSIANAIAIGSSIASTTSYLAAEGITTTEMYRRRRQEWGIARDSANTEVEQLSAQQKALKIRYTGAVLQTTYLETQQAQHQAQYALMTSKFTNLALYSWMRGRLSELYSQFYDQTVSRCLRAQYGYQWETLDTTAYIKPSAWLGGRAGLLCGEALMLNLATMEEAYQKWEGRALEVERTLSLAELYQAQGSFNLAEKVAEYVNAGPTAEHSIGKGSTLSIKENILSASFNINELQLSDDYPTAMRLGDRRLFKQISVTLPALLGPYQDVQAVLSYAGSNTGFAKGCSAIAISRGMNDSGQFQLDFNDSKYLPFEGIDIKDKGTFVLRFPNATNKQKELLQSLSDIILHIRYTIRA
ncbi:Tc toxin subunit A-related protein [Yersinia pekkanenii]|uniref:Insecticidal toxin complex protein n=1 Tax=Yersinia pekkanenii TaxID=1288385 RepID=A0A0T9PL33_9GAMM|nr:neuraminidase-like domain-containing protein [Yersinia pekkanenii]CNH70957.1 putative insecticidal toxin complex protein [Yersinia pekkanenii]CRY68197.1 putative insecticidal toxin complex protein [Yersinia pekkanenii]